MKDARPRRTRTLWATGLATAGLTTGLLAAAPAQSVVGDQVADGTHQYVVKLHIAGGTDNERACSGTLVDTQWVLTSASCFAADPQQATTLTRGAPPFPTLVTADGNKPTPAAELKQRVREIVPYAGRDLVMARLDDVSTAADPLDGPFPDISDVDVSGAAPAQGDQLKAVGYGRTKMEWTPERAHVGSYGVDLVNPTSLAISPAANGGALCKGDTGGPVLNADGRVVGVVTRAWDGGCLNSDETRTGAVATRVDDIADWVQRVRLTSRQKHITDTLTAADFDRDGRTDIAAKMVTGYSQVFLGRSDGTLEFGKHLSVLTRPTHKDLVAGDFLADSPGVEAITVDKDGNLSLARQRTVFGFPVSMWDHDKLWTDAAWKNALPVASLRTGTAGRDTLLFQWADGSLYTYKRDANGKLVNQKKSMWPDKTWKKKHIATGDFNGDGRDDIAAINADGALHLYTGKADGTFDKARSMWHDKTWGTKRAIVGGDFDGDGKADLAAMASNGELHLYAGDGKGALAAGKSMWPKV
ncbi:Repeat domain-containing protein [Streptomyces sp. cf386]|uniref:FG-GAP-like repeat-containing protein n=1 Tax=Streptomyces sp. cf386 TaxID=1761904 RepID=UPI000882B3C1|nr:FG-GAP-like repeat-containing protein [Streptomyces sp. cf386]SDM69736.1 Repeat domain-containing protein [Streptomyces sp. cf386]